MAAKLKLAAIFHFILLVSTRPRRIHHGLSPRRRKPVANNTKLRQDITAQIVASLEQNLRPWRRPWSQSRNTGRAANVVSKRAYTGINPLILELHRMGHGLGSRWYATFDQWRELGCMVKKRPDSVDPGRWGARIIFYSPIEKNRIEKESGELVEDRFFVMRTYTVFNADQVDGAEKWQATATENTEVVPDFAPAEELIAATQADIRQGGDHAFYNRTSDYIQVPPKARFNPSGAYYETVLHELAHWSEHRVGWNSEAAGYAANELVAEIASSFLATDLGVPQGESLDNHASYLKHWLDAMKGDSSFIFKASTQASKVADFLLGFVAAEEPTTEPAIVV
jgi:antirestriction protein ArdC